MMMMIVMTTAATALAAMIDSRDNNGRRFSYGDFATRLDLVSRGYGSATPFYLYEGHMIPVPPSRRRKNSRPKL